MSAPLPVSAQRNSGLVLLENVPSEVSHQDIDDIFGRYGAITTIARDLVNHRAEVQYEDFRDAAYALDEPDFLGQINIVGIRQVPFMRREEPDELEREPIFVEREAPMFESRRYMTVRDAGPLLQSGEITSYILDPQNQTEVSLGLTRLTLIGADGREYDILARYDSVTKQIYPPA